MTGRKFNPLGWVKALGSGEAGQALVETALTVSLFLVLLIGAAEFARLAFAAIEVANAAEAGAAYGAQNGSTANDTTGIQTAAKNDASNLTSMTATASTSFICSDGMASTGLNTDCPNSHIEEIITVNTQATVNPLLYVPGLPKTYRVRGKAIQKCGQ